MTKVQKLLFLFAIFWNFPALAVEYINCKTFEASTEIPASISSISGHLGADLWLSSNEGLARIVNGEAYLYRHEYGKNNSLPSDRVFSTLIDAKDNVWVLSDRALSRYRRSKDDFLAEDFVANAALSFSDCCLFASEQRIVKYDFSTSTFKNLDRFSSEKDCLVEAMYKWPNARLLLSLNTGELLLYDLSTQSAELVTIPEPTFSKIFVDSHFYLYAALPQGGFHVYDSNFNIVFKSKSKLNITCFTQVNNKILLGTNDGLFVYNPQDNSIIAYANTVENPVCFSLGKILSISSDEKGRVYLGRDRAGFAYLSRSYIRYTDVSVEGSDFLCRDGINSIYKYDNSDIIWCATNGDGIAAYNPSTLSFTRYPQTKGLRPMSMVGLADGKLLFFSFRDGFFTFDTKNASVSPFRFGHSELDSDVSSIPHEFIPVGGNAVLISSGKYLYFYESARRSIFPIELPAQAQGGRLYGANGDNTGRFFYNHRYIFSFNPADRCLICHKDIGEDTIIHSVARGEGTLLWIASDKGLFCFDSTSGELNKIENEFVPSPRSVLCDKQGLVWLSDSEDIYYYDPRSSKFYLLDESDGLPALSGIRPRSCLVTKENDIYLSGSASFVSISRDFKKPMEYRPQIILDRVMADSVYLTEEEMQEIGHNVHSIKLSFAVRNIDTPTKYRLVARSNRENFEYLSNTPELNLIDPLPGRFDIYVSCIGKDYDWTDLQKVGEIEILSHWTSSWYFMLLLVLCFVGLVFLLWRWIKKYRLSRNVGDSANGVSKKGVDSGLESGAKSEARSVVTEDNQLSKDMLSSSSHVASQKAMEGSIAKATEEDKQEDIPLPVVVDISDASILVVEDDKDLRSYIREELEEDADVVYEAVNGQDAIDFLQQKQVDIIISDVMMPVMDGFTFCRYVKTHIEISHIPVILLTARSDEKSQLLGYKNGADEYLTKPFDVDELKLSIEKLFKQRAKYRETFSTQAQPDIKEVTFSSADEALLTEFDRIVRENISDPDLDVKTIVDAMKMSRTVLFSKIKQLTGMNILGYINKCRMELVIELIKTTDYPMAEIAQRSGFSSSRYFSTSFKNYTGKTPSQYKKELN